MSFINEKFMIQNEFGQKLYDEYAKDMPIYDYHCHVNPKEIAEDKKYKNITEIWLGGDHYKWRTMRSNGVSEEFITGNAPDKEKFLKWADTIENAIGNPIYHWAHLELKKYFDIDTLLSSKTAEEIWEECNLKLQEPQFSCKNLIKRSNVKVICTTDDPCDTLEYHKIIKNDNTFDVKVLPTFRPDKAFNIQLPTYKEYIQKLSMVSEIKINDSKSLLNALGVRIEYFNSIGCKLSDHSLEPPGCEEYTFAECDKIFNKSISGKELLDIEIKKFKTMVMLFLGKEYARYNWTMQIHIGTIRNNNPRMFKRLGPDTGFDIIGDYTFAAALSKLLGKLDEENNLPKTILYNLNPRDNEVLGTIIGCFQDDSIPGKIQFGSGWWFCDHKDGMERQMIALGNLGLLSHFVGMLTDSRSFLSYTRHDYFRRILCNLLGKWVQDGEAPADLDLLGKMVQNISYNNAKNYFNL